MKVIELRHIPHAGMFIAYAHDSGIECLVRSADWYQLPPIQRYLYNLAARNITMHNNKVERRTYSFTGFELLRLLLERSEGNEYDTACEACLTWWEQGTQFGVVHLELSGPLRGDIISGDSPGHLHHFDPNKESPLLDVPDALFEYWSKKESA